MTFTHTNATGSGGHRQRREGDEILQTWFGARARRAIGFVALLALVAWIAIAGGQRSELSADRADSVQSLEAQQQPVLDGRGKWTGYLPY